MKFISSFSITTGPLRYCRCITNKYSRKIPRKDIIIPEWKNVPINNVIIPGLVKSILNNNFHFLMR